MPVDPREFTSARIEKPLRCGVCGYSLFTLPIVGRCPECGNRYNAAGRQMHGIFQPQYNVFPWGDVFTAGFSGVIAAVLLVILAAQRPFSIRLAVCAVPFVIMTVIAGPMAWQNVCRYFRFRRMEREGDDLRI